jgi:hypothetical protein
VGNIQSIPDIQFTNSGEQTFSELADSMPSTEQGFLDSVTPITQSEDAGGASSPITDVPPERKVVKVSKNIKKAMNKFKKKVTEFPIAWFHQQAKGNPEWELDDEEKDLITDAIGTVFELLDIEFAIEPLSVQLTSIWWVIAYPILTFVFLFLTKKSLTMEREQQEQQQAAQEEAMHASA